MHSTGQETHRVEPHGQGNSQDRILEDEIDCVSVTVIVVCSLV